MGEGCSKHPVNTFSILNYLVVSRTHEPTLQALFLLIIYTLCGLVFFNHFVHYVLS